MNTAIYIRNSIIRSIAGIVSGLLMILWPDRMISYLVMAIGALFALSGAYTLVLYYRGKTLRSFVYPIVSASGIILGGSLILFPYIFADILMYIWGILIVLAGIGQMVILIFARRRNTVAGGFYVLPALIAIAGVVILLHPAEARNYTLIILGTATLLYGISELIGWYKFRPPVVTAEDKKPEVPGDKNE